MFLDNRQRLLKFLAVRGAGDAAEDLLHELWLKISASKPGPIAAPLSYLFRAADTLMIDRYRSQRQAEKRDRDWAELAPGGPAGVSDAPSADGRIIARQHVRLVARKIDSFGPRAAAVFRRHRIDGISQREVAREMGVSLSTVESDLRRVYQGLADLREQFDEA